jgi:hypothetical protein
MKGWTGVDVSPPCKKGLNEIIALNEEFAPPIGPFTDIPTPWEWLKMQAQLEAQRLGLPPETAHSSEVQSWKGLLLDLKRRGLVIGPELAIADGALGFWQAIEEVWPKTRGQRCWVHKTANVLNRLPKSQQSKAKRVLQDIWMAETKNDANAAFDAFIETYAIKYDKAVGCLTKDREALLAFYDFPPCLPRRSRREFPRDRSAAPGAAKADPLAP